MQSSYPHPIIAREGRPFLAIAVAISLIVSWFSIWWSLPFWLATLFVLQFFRDPPRSVPADPGLVCAPADGRIVMVEKTEDPFANRPALKISVFMNVFNVHSNRAPVDGEVIPACKSPAWLPAASCVTSNPVIGL
jgi:phosphatidylserine decarboxylase